MGGINHQPCSKYLLESTGLSRSISLARASFEQGNAALEDIIILELQGSTGSIGPVNHHLLLSQDHIMAALAGLYTLKEKMHASGYEDLPPLHSIDFLGLGVRLAEAGLIDPHSWKKMWVKMQRETFYGNVAEFEAQLRSLLACNEALLEAVASLGDSADDGTLHLVLEENRSGNIKAEFARIYSAWNRFHADFLASSLISTEVWYAHMGYGSLEHVLEPAKIVA